MIFLISHHLAQQSDPFGAANGGFGQSDPFGASDPFGFSNSSTQNQTSAHSDPFSAPVQPARPESTSNTYSKPDDSDEINTVTDSFHG